MSVESDRATNDDWKAWCEEALNDRVLKRPKAIAFEGGGVLGLAYAEALRVAEQVGALVNTTDWAGTSAGSLAAAVMACGASSEFLERKLDSLDLRALKDDDSGLLRDLWRLYWKGGVAHGVKLSQWIGQTLQELTGDEEITFAQQYRRNRNRLCVVGTSITERKTLLFDYQSTPDVPIKRALVASCSYPLVFPMVEHDEHFLWDGGILHNFPIDVFDERRPVDLHQPHGRWPNRSGTLGLKLVLPQEYAPAALQQQSARRSLSVVDGLKGIVQCWSDAALRAHVNEQIDWPRTMQIRIEQPLSSMQFDLTEEQKAMLKRSGRNSALDYFAVAK